MAPLNPTINPTNDPNYRGYSSPVSPPDTIKPQGVANNQILPRGQEIGDRSAEYAGNVEKYKYAEQGAQLEAYGDLFKNIVQIGDFIGKASVAATKKEIEDKVYNIANKEREEYTKTLEQIKQTGVSKVMNPSPTSATTPEEIQSLGDTLTSLKSARDGGKISSSYYEGRLLAEAKKLRAQYPGFRQEIDNEFAKVTGSNPANAYIRALTTDINRAAASAGSEVKKAESFVAQRNGYPDAPTAMQKVQSGEWGLPQAMNWAAPYEREDFELKRRAALLNDNKLTKEAQQTKVGELFDYASGIAVGRIIDAQSARMGVRSAEDASKLDSAAKAGVVPQQHWIQWGQEVAQQKAAFILQAQRDARVTGAMKILGAEETNKRIRAAADQFDVLTDRIYNKDAGGYYRLTQDLKAINDETKKSLLTHPKLGPYMQITQGIKDLGGETNLKQFSLDIIKGNFPEDLKTFYSTWKGAFATQNTTDGTPATFNDMFDDMRRKGVNDKALNKHALGEVDKIMDGTIPEQQRLNIAQAAFSPGNRKMLSKISDEAQSPTFQKWTSPEMTRAMFELGKKDPQAWKNYTDWAQDTFAFEVANKDINRLAEIRNPHIKVGWDADNKRFVPRYDALKSSAEDANIRAGVPGYSRVAQEDPEYNHVVRVTNRLNSAIYNYKNIAEAAGIDPDTLIIQTIAKANPEAIARTDTIPHQILRDIGLAKAKGIGSK